MFYVLELQNIGSITKKGLYLVPDNWDDFGYKTNYTLYYVNNNSHRNLIGYTKIGYKGQVRGRPSLPSKFNVLPKDYFSLGQDLAYYKNIRLYGDDFREYCLKGLRDLAYYKTAMFIA